MSFAFPALAAIGAALALAPIVVHLLNRRRRRVVAWAAMDFLLASSRINRTRIVLTEWLLLAARVVAIVLAGLVAAGPRATDALADWFGRGGATHYVLLDDTASMQRSGADGAAWEEAIAAVERLTETAREHGDRVTVLRYSDTLTGEASTALIGDDAATPVATGAWRAGATAAAAPGAVRSLVAAVDEDDRPGPKRAYILSDFALGGHRNDAAWGTAVADLSERVDGILLATCGEPESANLTISRLTLTPGPRADGVEERLVVEVTNHDDDPAPTVTVGVSRDARPLTSVKIGPFDPREAKTVELPIRFGGSGSHVVEATLPADALGLDNRRSLAVEVAGSREVLLLSEATAEARVFSAALRPLGSAASGWAPKRDTWLNPDYLINAAAVVVLDKASVTRRVADLLSYARNGGGVLVVAGPTTEGSWFNRLWNEVDSPGFGSRVLGPATSPSLTQPGEAMIRVADHPAMRAFQGVAKGFVPLVRVYAKRRLDAIDATAARVVSNTSDPDSNVMIRMADGSPLLVEAPIGAGLVQVLLTTTATGEANAPPWSNLATLPVFPVLVNDLVARLSQERLRPLEETIGSVIPAVAQPRDALLRWEGAQGLAPAPGLGAGAPLAPAGPGVYRRRTAGVDGPVFAATVDARESDLSAESVSDLRVAWQGVAEAARARDLFREDQSPADSTLLYAVVAGLLALLIAERLLALSCSHVGSAVGTARVGGAG